MFKIAVIGGSDSVVGFKALGLDTYEVDSAEQARRTLHEITRPRDDEYAIIKTHTVMGARILSNIKKMPSLVTGARWHHERYDGKGYPDSLVGKGIPEEARIIAVADAYDAMTSRRSYRNALPQKTVRMELEQGRGSQFDPVFADIMLAMIDEDPEYRNRFVK